MENYARYIKERENKFVLANEKGFMVYKILDKECFLAEMFIQVTSRGTGLFEQMILELNDLAKLNKCEVITANIDLRDKGANRNLRASQKLDFKVIQANNNVLLIERKVS